MPSLGNLFVNIGADTSGLQTGANKAESRLTKLRGTMNRVSMSAAKIGGSSAAAGAAIAAGLTKKGLNAVDAQAKLARQLGTTQATMAGMERAAADAGISQQQLGKNLQALDKRLGEAQQGTGQAQDALDQLGLSADRLSQMPVDQRLELIRSRMQQLDSSTQRASVAADLFSRSGQDMANMAEEGSTSIAAATKEAQQFGVAVSGVDAAQIEAANDAMSRISDVNQGVSNQLAVQMAPILEGISNQFTDTAKEAGGIGNIVESMVDRSVGVIGFLADTVEGVRRTFVIAGQAVATLGLTIVRNMMRSAETILSGPVDAINQLIETANMVPGIDFGTVEQPEFVQGLQEKLAIAEGAVEEGKKAMHRTLMEPMPSESIDNWVKKQREASEQAAVATVNARNKQKNQVMAIERQQAAESNKLSAEEREKEQQRRAQNLQRLKKNMATERELEVMNFEKRMEWLKEARESELVTEMEFFKRMQALKMGHERKMTQIDNKGLTEREKFQRKSMDNQVAQVAGSLQKMTSSVARENKAMFRLNQIAGIASATINAYQGFNQALAAYPPPLSYAMAGAQLASGMAKVSAIKSQSFSKGGGGSAGGGAPPAQTGARSTQQGTGAGEGGASSPTTMINLQGDSFGRDQVRDLLERINEENRDGGRLVIN